MQSWIISILTPVFSVNNSNMLICYTDLLLLVLKPVVLFNISVFILFMNINLKRMAFEIKIFCNLNIFTVTSGQINASFLKEKWTINKWKITDFKLLNGSVCVTTCTRITFFESASVTPASLSIMIDECNKQKYFLLSCCCGN